jgi:hypothetical protein
MKRPRKRRVESGRRSGQSRQTQTVGSARAGRVGSARRIDSETSRFVPGRPALGGGNTRSEVEIHGRGTPRIGVGVSELRCKPQRSSGATRATRLPAKVQQTSSDGWWAGSGRSPRRTEWEAGTGTVACDRSGGATGHAAQAAGRAALTGSLSSMTTYFPESGRVGPRGRCERMRNRETESEPHGREWLKQATGHTEA